MHSRERNPVRHSRPFGTLVDTTLLKLVVYIYLLHKAQEVSLYIRQFVKARPEWDIPTSTVRSSL